MNKNIDKKGVIPKELIERSNLTQKEIESFIITLANNGLRVSEIGACLKYILIKLGTKIK